jgi:nitrogen fixation NifU-like protein
MSLEDLYREVIIDHYRSPRNRTPLDHPDASAEGVNPLCGDEVTVELDLTEDGAIEAISVRGQGCSISQSSASMMSDLVKGKSRAEIDAVVEKFRAMMDLDGDATDVIDPENPGSVLGDIEALYGVRKSPVPIKCANLPWTTLAQALEHAN